MTSELDVHVFTKPLPIHRALAIEQTLFDKCISTQSTAAHSNKYVLLFWKSQKAVVIGRNQNPWKECNCAFLQENDIVLARRDSGGGAVFHDEGNLNVSVFSPTAQKGENRIQSNLTILTQALKSSHHIQAHISEHNDVLVGEKKITGSAMRIIKTSLLHHFTLLLNADLSLLKKTLRPIDYFAIETKSVASRPHSVANIHCAANLIIEAYIHHFEKTLKTQAHVVQHKGGAHEFHSQEETMHAETRLAGDAWIFGRTPVFEVLIPLQGMVHTAVFSDGMLREVKYSFQGITPYTEIHMSPTSLRGAAENKQESALIRRIAAVLYSCYYRGMNVEGSSY